MKFATQELCSHGSDCREQAASYSGASASAAGGLAEVEGVFSLSFQSLAVCRSPINLGTLGVLLLLCLWGKTGQMVIREPRDFIQDNMQGGRIWTRIFHGVIIFTRKASSWLKACQDGFVLPLGEMPDLLMVSSGDFDIPSGIYLTLSSFALCSGHWTESLQTSRIILNK